jgi:hypothetical protein
MKQQDTFNNSTGWFFGISLHVFFFL